MQVTIDIPEPLYAKLESQANATKVTLETLMLDGASRIVAGDQSADAVPRRPTALSMNLNLNDFALMTNEEIQAFEEQFAQNPEGAVRDFGIRRLNGSE